MVAKGKFGAGLNQGSEHTRTCRTVGVRNFKVYRESEALKADADAKKPVTLNKGASSTTGQGALNNMEKSKAKPSSAASTIVGRKALADVSNIKDNSSRSVMQDGPKLLKDKSQRTTALPRASLGPAGKLVNLSSRKSFMGKVQESKSQGGGSQRDGSRNKTMAQKHDSVVTNGRRTATNSLLSNRKSLPVLKGVKQADSSIPKRSAENSDKGKERIGYLVGKTGNKVAPLISNARSHLLRSRASDGFIIMGQTNVESRALARKSIRPLMKTTLQATHAPRNSNSNTASHVNKRTSVAAISSQNKVEPVTSSLPDITALPVLHEAIAGQFPSDADGNPDTVSDISSRRKSDRRRSYTSSLITRSKLVEKCGEIVKLEMLPSIDDNRNELEVAEYIDEIYQYYWVTEAHNPSLANYMSIQTEVTAHVRGILINWLIEVHFKFDLMQETLYLMVTLLDRYLSQATIKKNDMQLVGLTALLLASKYEDFWHPRIKDLISISAEPYTREQMLGMERLILKQLKFRLNVPTPYVFMLRFLKAAQSDTKSLCQLEHLGFYLIELCLIEYEALKFKPSLLCASAIYVARCTLHMTPAWTPLLCKHARYEESQLRDCAEMILRFHKAAGTGQLKVTYEKYKKPDLSGVAALTTLDRLPL
ncbi:putative cyclin-B3-1 [Morella rubra]|uniref:B-like cyclin n=1 Tax=Morella rubra TaxID=262757 RepID=A0A6A1VVB3_9ROSI|nr:putative cyclin-B3-1 [Morella rubra]